MKTVSLSESTESLASAVVQEFREQIDTYYQANRRSFPWRETTDPYSIMVSEIMLQQTQTDRVVPKYRAFLTKFPNFAALAAATTAEVLTMWQGLGYNRRALALKRSAEQVVTEWKGHFPPDLEQLVTLPGIGKATASAILAFAFNQPVAFIETNIRRVYIHFFFEDAAEVSDKELMPLIAQTVDVTQPREWYYALMDYGAMLPKVLVNPNRRSAHYAKQSPFEGLRRQVRGKILKLLVAQSPWSVNLLVQEASGTKDLKTSEECLLQLAAEGFVVLENDQVALAQK